MCVYVYTARVHTNNHVVANDSRAGASGLLVRRDVDDNVVADARIAADSDAVDVACSRQRNSVSDVNQRALTVCGNTELSTESGCSCRMDHTRCALSPHRHSAYTSALSRSLVPEMRTSQNRTVPHGGLGADRDLPDDRGIGRDEHVVLELRTLVVQRHQATVATHCRCARTQAKHQAVRRWWRRRRRTSAHTRPRNTTIATLCKALLVVQRWPGARQGEGATEGEIVRCSTKA